MAIPRLLVVAGPTATGKSELGLRLAERLDGEIVNVDSMQLYRGMDIGTAKVPPQQRRGVPHFELDVLDISERASVAAYQRAARADIDAILARDHTPILVGGSALYLLAVVDDLDFPGADAVVRARLEQELAEQGVHALHARLADRDPESAAQTSPTDARRIIRALEVLEVTGQPPVPRLPTPPAPRHDVVMLFLDRDTAELDARIERRVDRMLDAGLLDEVASLATRGLRDSPTAGRAIGYAAFLDVLEGQRTVEQARAATVTATRRMVRRQRAWYRRDPRWTPVPADHPDLLALVMSMIGAPGGLAVAE